MSNWADEKISRNKKISNQIVPDLEILITKYPNEKDSIEEIIQTFTEGQFNDEYLLETRNKLRRMITKDEYNLIRKKDDIWNLNNKIKQIEKEFHDLDHNEINEYFLDEFDFKAGRGYYYLRLPKLHVYTDKKEKSELMTDRYIRDFISNFLSDFQENTDVKIEVFEEFTLIFLHHLKPENAEKYDTDNIEIKKPIDGINGRLIVNDTANRSDICQIIVPDNDEYTELYVLKGHSLGNSVTSLLSKLN